MARIDVQKREDALTLRASGKTYAQIGKALGCSTSRAARIVAKELQRLMASRGDVGEAARELEMRRLDSLLAAVWDKGQDGDLDAWDRCLACIMSRARLMGMGAAGGKKGSAPSVVVQIIERELDDARRSVQVIETSALPAPDVGSVAESPPGEQDAANGNVDAAKRQAINRGNQ